MCYDSGEAIVVQLYVWLYISESSGGWHCKVWTFRLSD